MIPEVELLADPKFELALFINVNFDPEFFVQPSAILERLDFMMPAMRWVLL